MFKLKCLRICQACTHSLFIVGGDERCPPLRTDRFIFHPTVTLTEKNIHDFCSDKKSTLGYFIFFLHISKSYNCTDCLKALFFGPRESSHRGRSLSFSGGQRELWCEKLSQSSDASTLHCCPAQ